MKIQLELNQEIIEKLRLISNTEQKSIENIIEEYISSYNIKERKQNTLEDLLNNVYINMGISFPMYTINNNLQLLTYLKTFPYLFQNNKYSILQSESKDEKECYDIIIETITTYKELTQVPQEDILYRKDEIEQSGMSKYF